MRAAITSTPAQWDEIKKNRIENKTCSNDECDEKLPQVHIIYLYIY